MSDSPTTSSPLLSTMKWSLFADWASKAVPPLVFIVLARLLTPADFGVMSAALVVIAFSRIFWEAGLGKAVIQYRGEIDEGASAAFWINIALGVVAACALFASAGAISRTFFRDPRVALVLQVMTVDVFLGALAATHTALLQREMRFRELFWVRVVSVCLPALASIPLALAGMGYWALVAGTLAGQAAQVVMLWRGSRWRPGWRFDSRAAKALSRFGVWVAASGLIAWIYMWADSFIAGHYFGTAVLGLYRVGNQSASMPFELLFAFAAPVLYSRFSARAHDFVSVRDELLKITSVVGAVSLPVALSLIVYGPLIETVIFGAKWRGLATILALIAAKEGLLWIFAYHIEAYRALARPHLETAIAFLSAAANPVILIVCAERGFDTFLFGRAVILGIVGVIIHASFGIAVLGASAVRRTYASLLVIFVVCAALFVVRELLHDAVDSGAVRALVDGIVVIAGFVFSVGLQRSRISELARA